MDIKGYLKKRKVLIIILVIAVVLIEIVGFAAKDTISGVARLDETSYSLDDVLWVGYSREGRQVISNSSSDHVIIDGISSPVKNISIGCENDTKAISYITYKSKPDTSKEEIYFVSLDKPINVLSLSEKVEMESLKVFLTDREQDDMICTGFILNDRTPYGLNAGRIIIYLLVFILVGCVDTLDKAKKKAIENFFHSKSLLLFSIIIAILDLTYPVVLTYDSGHYLWLSNLIRTNQLQLWDPIRNVGFPLYLHIGQILLGYNQMSALIPMIINHTILYVFSCLVIFEVFDLTTRQKSLVKFAVLLFIALDPTVFGYYHVLLTEQLAATIAMVSCFVAIKLYTSKPLSSNFYICLAYFIILIPIAWFIKQPYLGTALFPFLVAAILAIMKHKSMKVNGIITATLLLAMMLLGGLSFSWNKTLVRAGNAMDPDRQFSTWVVRLLASDSNTKDTDVGSFLYKIKENYLLAANFHVVEKSESGESLLRIQLTRSAENGVISHRLFTLDDGNSNLFHAPPYEDGMNYLRTHASPPRWLDQVFEFRLIISNIMFTISYFLLPFVTITLVIIFLIKPKDIMAALIILVCLSFLNAFIHSVFASLDRYYFLGYPVLLCLWILFFIKLGGLISFDKRFNLK